MPLDQVRSSPGPLTVLTTVAVAVVLLLAVAVWVHVAQMLTQRIETTRSAAAPEGLVWGKRVYTSEAALRRALERQGIDYRKWRARHATAVAIVRHKPLPKRPARVKPKVAPHPARRAARATPARSGGSSLVGAVVRLLPWLAAALALGLAVAPARVWWRVSETIEIAPEVRMALGAAATAVVLGLIVARI